jgi:hypothetical protein
MVTAFLASQFKRMDVVSLCPLVNSPVRLCHFSVKLMKCFRNVNNFSFVGTLVCSGANNNTPIIAAVSIQTTNHVFVLANFPTA